MFDDFSGFNFKNTGLDPEPIYHRSPRGELVDALDTIVRTTSDHAELKIAFEEWLTDNGYKPSKRVTHPMPRVAELIEVSIWDNWCLDKPRKGQPSRYGVNIKAWTHKDVNFRSRDDVDWSGRVTLMSPAALRKASTKAQQIKGQTYPISPEFAAMIETGCVSMESNGWSGGMLVTKPVGEGTLRHDRQMMFVDTNAVLAGDLTATAIIFVDEETALKLPDWSPLDAAGKALPEKFEDKTGAHSVCVAQIRYARDADRFHGWVSGRT